MENPERQPTVESMSVLPLTVQDSERGILRVLPEMGVAMDGRNAVRLFTVTAGPNVSRGGHAHRQCQQALMVVHGEVQVECSDAISHKNFLLSRDSGMLVIPPGIWAKQCYLEAGSVLLVLCDRPYEPEDYIHNRDEFLKWRGSELE